MWGKDDGSYDSLTSGDESPDFIKNKEAKEAQIKKEAQEAQTKKEKNERKERRDNVTILFPHLCFKVAPWSSW